MTPLLIDGSVLEGGGQILRNSVSLSALLQKSVRIHNIRNGRKPPGLKNQHRTGLELAARIASANLTGAKNGSAEIEFVPGHIKLPSHHHADTFTAGSITLLLQIATPLLLFSRTAEPSTLSLHGGTNAIFAPQVDYTKHVFLPFLLNHFGVPGASLQVKKRGYYPKGGGEVAFSLSPLTPGQKLRSVSLLERGSVTKISGISHYAGLPAIVGKGMVSGAKRVLQSAGFIQGDEANLPADATPVSPTVLAERRDVPLLIDSVREPNHTSKGGGSGIVLWAELSGGSIIGGSAIGSKGKDPEAVGEEAANELLKGLDERGCVDEWTQDQIIVFMALAEGKSEVRCGTSGLSLHTRTSIWLAEQLTDAKFEVKEEEDGRTVISCHGIGYTIPLEPSS